MMASEMETENGVGCDLNCSMGPTIDAKDDDKGGLVVYGSSGVVSFGEGTSAMGLRTYTRRKRRKMSNSDEMVKSEFNDKKKASNQDIHRLDFDTFPIGPNECSLRHCSKMHPSLNGHVDGLGGCIQNAYLTYGENGLTSVIKESLDNVERSDDQMHNSGKELFQKPSEGSRNSELCGRAFSDILNSDKFSELRGLIVSKFGDVNVNRVLGVDAINLKMENRAYETSPMLYFKDIQQTQNRTRR